MVAGPSLAAWETAPRATGGVSGTRDPVLPA